MVIHIFPCSPPPNGSQPIKNEQVGSVRNPRTAQNTIREDVPTMERRKTQWKIERVAACRIMAATLVFNVACKTVLQLLIVNLSQIRHVSAPHWSEIEGWLAHSLIGFCSVTLEDTKLLILMQGISIDPVSWMIRAGDLSWESNEYINTWPGSLVNAPVLPISHSGPAKVYGKCMIILCTIEPGFTHLIARWTASFADCKNNINNKGFCLSELCLEIGFV